MKLVIDIPDEKYEEIMLYTQYLTSVELTHFEEVVKNGTPFPKGHGRLIDTEHLVEEHSLAFVRNVINNTSTIIEADGVAE